MELKINLKLASNTLVDNNNNYAVKECNRKFRN